MNVIKLPMHSHADSVELLRELNSSGLTEGVDWPDDDNDDDDGGAGGRGRNPSWGLDGIDGERSEKACMRVVCLSSCSCCMAAFARARSREEGLDLDEDEEAGDGEGPSRLTAWASAYPKGVRSVAGQPTSVIMDSTYHNRCACKRSTSLSLLHLAAHILAR